MGVDPCVHRSSLFCCLLVYGHRSTSQNRLTLRRYAALYPHGASSYTDLANKGPSQRTTITPRVSSSFSWTMAASTPGQFWHISHRRAFGRLMKVQNGHACTQHHQPV